MVIDNGDMELLRMAERIGLVTKRNVESLSKYAEEVQEMGMVEELREWKN